MSWLLRYRLYGFLSSFLWMGPLAGLALAIACAPALRRLDDAYRPVLFGYGPEGARAIVVGLVAAVFSCLVFVCSILLVAIQIASANLSPRIIHGQLSQPPVRVCMGILVFTFFYGLAVLGRIEERVPQLPVALVVVSCLAAIVAFLRLIDFMSSQLRPVSVLAKVGSEGSVLLETLYPEPLGEASRADPTPAPGPAPAPPPGSGTLEVRSRRGGVVCAFDAAGLVALARAADCTLELRPRVGDYVARGDVLFRVHGQRQPPDVRRLLRSVALGDERTLTQDPGFPLRIIVDIAAKALSPAINDPTTAVLALDHVHHLLRTLGLRRLDAGVLADREGRARFFYRTPDWEDFVGLALTEIRQFGAGSIQVARRMRVLLEDLIATLPAERRATLVDELRRLERSAERSFADADDREAARQADAQGLGARERAGRSPGRVPGTPD